MYAFGPLPRQKRTGRVIGTHQKIDRVARRHISKHVDNNIFPSVEDVLHFEGSRGPDGIKLKSPGRDEPWHFIDPASIKPDDALLGQISSHSQNLTTAIAARDMTRASFEAAWLAHAVTDGLTPAHHEPLEAQLKNIKHQDDRRHKVRSKIVMTGNGSRRQFIRNNWKYWGAKGIMTTHTLFEAGVATAAKPLQFNAAAMTERDKQELAERGFVPLYIDMVEYIAELGMYDRFKRDGWTQTLARQTTRELMPTIIHAVELAWYEAYDRAEGIKK
ncbi:hypothetical protein H7142_02685 [Candidatus Saccharibacteria bacterium]|nr:hypothetical protein [Candidatus Saccharibacteria bacterium]